MDLGVFLRLFMRGDLRYPTVARMAWPLVHANLLLPDIKHPAHLLVHF